jgi:hypothetical protein
VTFFDGEKKLIKYEPQAVLEAILLKICAQRSLVYADCTFVDAATEEKVLAVCLFFEKFSSF